MTERKMVAWIVDHGVGPRDVVEAVDFVIKVETNWIEFTDQNGNVVYAAPASAVTAIQRRDPA